MCLAVPAKVVEISGKKAKVDFGGVFREVDVSLVTVNPGDYVIVHAGYAIEVMDRETAEETLKIWEEILSA
ncbi:MAG: HypC/HybG/HupF family hydrogenase formation chaperone [Thermoplasmata archaeon]